MTAIELHILTYFLLIFLIFSLLKEYVFCKCKMWVRVLCSLIFAVIKFLMDYFSTMFFAQIVVIFFVLLCMIIIICKPKHISQLVAFVVLSFSYLLIVVGLDAFLQGFLERKVSYVGNLYLCLVIGFSLTVYAMFLLFHQYFIKKKKYELIKECKMVVSGTEILLTGYVDTGNKLVDGISRKSVVIVNLSAIKKHVKDKMYADIILSTNSCGKLVDVHKIKYATISGTNFMTVFKPDKFLVENREIDCYVGISVHSTIQEYDCLLNRYCL